MSLDRSQAMPTRGSEHYIKGVRRNANPYHTNTLAAADWDVGWVECRVSELDMLQSDKQDEAEHEKYASQSMRERLMPSADEVATAIGIPVEDWPMNCYTIACAIAKSGVLDSLKEALGESLSITGNTLSPRI